MNTKQKVAIWFTVTIMAILLIFPPWRFEISSPVAYGTFHESRIGGYSFILSPPEVPVTGKSQYGGTELFFERARTEWSPNIDYTRMLLPLIASLIIGFATFFSLGNKHD